MAHYGLSGRKWLEVPRFGKFGNEVIGIHLNLWVEQWAWQSFIPFEKLTLIFL